VGQVPIAGPFATGLFDDITGASGAPDQGSLPHKYMTSSTTGGGLQGSGDAGAHVNLGPLQGGVDINANANAGLQRVTYGSQKGDWQLVAGLNGNATGALADWLFGGQASAAGNVKGQVTVTYSPSGAPLTLQVTASGDKVWGVAPPSYIGAKSPDGATQPGGEGEKTPVLDVQNATSGGTGDGSTFTGTLDLSNDPQAAQDVTAILEGDTARIGDLVSQMNSNGTETIQTYHITRSDSKVGAGLSAGAGVGANLSDGNSNATYNPPQTREHGGQWHTGS
jgi:hypothetical protein